MEDLSEELVNALKGIVFDCNWQNVGKASDFKQLKCYRFYSLDEIDEDIVLIKDKKENFYAIEANCSHEGGPLDMGDIEELDQKLYIICPWHSFDFNLTNGLSSTGLKQQTFDAKVVNGDLYINTCSKLSLNKENRDDQLNGSKGVESETISQENKKEELSEEETLSYWAAKILNTADPYEKCRLTDLVAAKWYNNELKTIGDHLPPDEPKRKNELVIVDPGKIRRGKGGTLASRVALLHSLANIEQWAIDLSWDIVCRFSHVEFPDKTKLPKEFFTDFIKVACDEAKHFNLLEKRLIELESCFGALPVHNGLWESATVTKDDLLSRLSIVHMVHEARGLDVHPQTRLRFLNQKDQESIRILDILYEDEITHVAAGLKWFQYCCNKYDLDYIDTFHKMVKKYFKGYLKPPFDTDGRYKAGMIEEWYMPLIKPSTSSTEKN